MGSLCDQAQGSMGLLVGILAAAVKIAFELSRAVAHLRLSEGLGVMLSGPLTFEQPP